MKSSGFVFAITVGLVGLLVGCESDSTQKQGGPRGREGKGGTASPGSTHGGPVAERQTGGEGTFYRAPVEYGHMYFPAEADTSGKAGPPTGAHAPGSYDPSVLMPLAVGNKWTYRWRSAAAPGADTADSGDSMSRPMFRCTRFYILGERVRTFTVSSPRARAHEETYTIVRRNGEAYLFEVASSPEVPPEQLRDGRYGDAVERAWTWSQTECRIPDSAGCTWRILTESLKRKTELGPAFFPQGGVTPETILEDHRKVLFIPFLGGKWAYSALPSTLQAAGYRVAFKVSGTRVEVPAGGFDGCLETIEYSTQAEGQAESLQYRTHTFWAPGTGIVREFQEFGDKSVSYELELLRFVKGSGPTP